MGLVLAPCCCQDCGPCPTKAEAGLPDSISTSFAVLASSSSGMPVDTDIGNCAGGDPYMRWTHSAAIVGLLSSITWDYVESAAVTSCGCCCFRYEGRTNYTPECGGGSGILLGDSPFESYATGESYSVETWSGTDILDPEEPIVGACCNDQADHDSDCIDIGASGYVWEGTLKLPKNLYASAELLLCINGNVVTICGTINLSCECKSRAGHGGYTGATSHSCDPQPEFEYGVYVEECASTTTSTINLSASADLSGVSGANIWEKIKNAPAESWVSDYESAHCNCGSGGCVDSFSLDTWVDCTIDQTTCIVDPHSLDSIYLENAPIDLDCLYAVGTLDIAFADA